MLLVDDMSEFHWSGDEDRLHTYCMSDLTIRGLAKASPEMRFLSQSKVCPGRKTLRESYFRTHAYCKDALARECALSRFAHVRSNLTSNRLSLPPRIQT